MGFLDLAWMTHGRYKLFQAPTHHVRIMAWSFMWLSSPYADPHRLKDGIILCKGFNDPPDLHVPKKVAILGQLP